MKRTLLILSICMSSIGCVGSDSKGTPKLEINGTEINFCSQTAGETTVWNNVQLRNTGKGPLTLSSLRVRGDAGCAFACTYLDPQYSDVLIACPSEVGGGPQAEMTIEAGHTLLVRIEYTPSAAGTQDAAALVIKSDAENQIDNSGKVVPKVIPMCGTGIDAEGEDADGGLPDASLDDGSCAACESLPSDAETCKTR